MKSIFLTVSLLAIAAVTFAEEVTEKKKELSETGVTVLEKLRELRKEQEELIAKIESDTDRELITSVFKKELETADETEVAATRVKRASARRRANRRANRRRFARRLRRNQRRAAQKRRAHARRHQRNLRRAARKIRRIQRRG
ncbi:monovalent cation/H+ antiporter subunit C domain protein [Ostertagia ostertagi]